ncbi:cell wall glucanase, putative [Talaromyces stipitatus ATCC 10500]|uniref:glucan endo-1,3-beta-D-glucosidase n=1 Tax=Talaromyces stipitatus (strain ATCC 10500 / CBS 375.48 / QM 6759 / NRRL 1006) TaxID=441959 RepID=B8MCZ3_TALSN|nr:cell wall glucanase, putative [Talaromyces stipitatus ATCC 10500]EED17519.1 cell wall glucanase, putative [Talaromyces stipitatus ATCC 10500]
MSRQPGTSFSRGEVSPITSDIQSTSSQISPVSDLGAPRGFRNHPSTRQNMAYNRAQQPSNIDTDIPPEPPQHRSIGSPSRDMADNRPPIDRSTSLRTNVTATPGADNLSAAAVGGGISGIAYDVASRNQRESGLEAVRSIGQPGNGYYEGPSDGHYTDGPYGVTNNPNRHSQVDPSGTQFAANMPLGGSALAASTPPQQRTPSLSPSNPSQISVGELYPRYPSGGLYDGPYHSFNSHDPTAINPNDIADDGDDDLMNTPPQQQRRSWFGKKSTPALAAGAAGGAAAGGVLGAVNSLRGGPTTYESVPTGAGGAGQSPYEKDAFLTRQADIAAAKKRKRWLLTLLVGFAIVAVIVGAIVGGILGSQAHSNSSNDSGKSSSGGGGSGSSSDPGTNINTAAGDLATNGDLDKNSPEIVKLMNNPDLHRVFHGMDYTSWGVQYPLCLKYPPSPNNVTRDMAILSQLTNTVRVYGTDCNQTQMVLHSINQLGLTDMKLWLGVWVNSNETTTNRQIETLYDVIDNMNDTKIIEGVIVGNEVLFSGGFSDQSTAQKTLISYIENVRSNLTAKGLKVPVATSDLGDNWTQNLVDASDLVMANVHPFFGGVQVDKAAAWTVDFFNNHDVALTTGTSKEAYISEVGWPSAGGNDCGSNKCTDSTSGSVAGIDEMNQFLSDWVCPALNNGTKYFWFEAFDEPWKVIYDTPGQEWEDKWGLMDSARNLKPGLKIPDCGGKTV